MIRNILIYLLRKVKIHINLSFILLTVPFFNINSAESVYIRVNQVGFLPGEIKTAVVMSEGDISGSEFRLIKKDDKKTVFTGRLPAALRGEGKFKNNCIIDFSALRKPGRYIIECRGARSHPFSVGNDIYNGIADSLLMFFKVQRCGYTDPFLHKVCHIADATALIPRGQRAKHDVTGGWHDAGDYIKFFNTTAFSTYLLLFSYEFDPLKFSFDTNGNNVPDILEEAKIGLDWLLRSRLAAGSFIIQVQDLRDHDEGWRLPEDDKLTFDRPAFTGGGKNSAGIYSAVMALAYRIWKERLHYDEFALRCLKEARTCYSEADRMPEVDHSGTGMYLDSKYEGKMALGAIELYESTKDEGYLKDAASFASKAQSDYWWSWGDMNSIADFKIAKHRPEFKDYLLNNLKNFNDIKNKNVFGEAAKNTWGSNTALMGAALQAILWKNLTGSGSFDSLMVFERDYILGKNQWGVSFIYNIGSVFSKNFHSQVGFLRNGYLPGAVAAGPISRKKLETFKVSFPGRDPLRDFQTDSAVYQDLKEDYVTNEPSISTNVTALFLMGYFAQRH
ncbi:MAG TPA: glycoside hydrolase family 9 protein [Ignavibacteriales bacterium]|nr:glycoside hydrolase family 9 protein [Ignavibacteriales bacterium]